MITLLRKKRKQLIQENGMNKYLKYAIGEIILVVVGILIALSINNWNSNRIKSNKIDNTIFQVVQDLRIDVDVAQKTLDYYLPLEDHYHQMMSDSVTLEDVQNCEPCLKLITRMIPFTPTQVGFDLLRKHETNLKSPRDTLILDIKEFYGEFMPLMELINHMIQDDVTNNLNDWKESKKWYAHWINGKYDTEFYEYLANDPFYKNKVASFYLIIYKNYLLGLENYIIRAKELISRGDFK